MSDLLKSRDIQELFKLSPAQLFQYRDIFNIEIIEKIEGKKKIYYYPSESVELIREIMELKKLGHSHEIIRNKLGINKSDNNNSINDPESDLIVVKESFINDKINDINDGLQEAIKLFYSQFADTKGLQESLINYSQNAGKYQAESLEKDKLINEIKINQESNLNQINTIHKLEIESLNNQIEMLKSELESKNIEIQELKKPWWKKK